MKIFRADLHIHTVLSPCASLEMSPAKIIEKALEQNLDLIAITDHNSTRQCALTKRLAERRGLSVLLGCEVNTAEEVHVLCFFKDLKTTRTFQEFMDKHLPRIPNQPDFLGYQLILDEQEMIVGEEPYFLGSGLHSDIETIGNLVHKLEGIFIPAHIDRPHNSIFSQLGFLPPGLKTDALQLSRYADEYKTKIRYNIPTDITMICCSDAHYPEEVGSGATRFFMERLSFDEIKLALNRQQGRYSEIEK